MYKISYEVPLEDTEDCFVISSYDCGNPRARDDVKTCPAIKMTITNCESKNALVSHYEVVCPHEEIEDLPQDFRNHFKEIIDCQYEGWKLVEIMVNPAGLELEYYCKATGERVSVTLDIKGSRIRKMSLELEVPTPDGSSAAAYRMWLEHDVHRPDDDPRGSTLIEADYPHLHQRRIFMLTMHDPYAYKLSVTDIYDL